ncbi:MAG TPA: two-component regulator propeller domain-containing protein, partial [Flavobacteriales bacterium]|nr:two-component regulator propeller domain-containing protein [Flavobacteriales bacterium]
MRSLFFLSLFLAWCPSVAQRYNIWKHFNSNNGLPQNSVVNLLADTAGYVWVATEGGLVRYDGGSIRVFELKAQGSLPAKRIRSLVPSTLGEVLVEDANGNIYEIHGHIAPVFRAGSKHVGNIKGGVPSAEVYLRNAKPRSAYNMAIYHWPARHPYSSTEQVVVGMDSIWQWNDTVVVEKLAIERPLQRAFFLGTIAFGIDHNGSVVRIDTRTGATTPVHADPTIAPALEWPEVFWSLDQQEGFLVTERGLFGVTTNNGADTLRLAPYDVHLPTAGSITSVIRVPGTDVLLIGTSTSGLFALRPDPLQAVDHSSPSGANGAVFAQAVLPNGDVLFVRSGQGYRVGPSGTSAIGGLTGANSFILPTDHQGHVWVCHHQRLSRFDPNTWEEQVIIPSIEIGLALKAVGDSVLISDGNSIKVWRNGHLHELARLSSSSYLDWPSTLYVDDEARLWYGADRGLFRRNKANEGFRSIKGLENKDIRSIT